MWLSYLSLVSIVIPALFALRVYLLIRYRDQKPKRQAGETCSLGVFLGSGGHTAEMVALLSTIDLERYTPRVYVYCWGDEMSLRAISTIESSRYSTENSTQPSYSRIAFPRARKVGQSWFSTILTTIRTLFHVIWYTFLVPLTQPRKPWVDVLLVNGPGTCVVLVLVCWIRRILGLSYTRIIYVESFARVRSLSLSGKLLRPFVDTFVVQWPSAGGKGTTYKGWLV
ncbi:hypothetical protein M231_03304 [Tremella mesenterica]|uniref:UDP-N-acetylglucosamine transferase subunit ALG14 n=1 Tax=Tremella mesenterica TaxID=5217 RepID=A0A4Q1BNM4_TREME|nr:hypothetical protein M231_03304 [Tremella mesenterica]